MKKKFILLSGLFLIAFSTAPAQIITTFAGNGAKGYSGDGIAASSCEFAYPSGVFLSKAGNLYVADDSNVMVRMIDTAGIITHIAGNGTSGYSGDGGPATAAQLDQPWKMVLDNAGNLYISDVWNQVIRKVDTAGIITTYAGTYGVGSYAGDGGPATAAYLNHPVGITVDKFRNVYIGDVVNNVVRKIDTTGIITTVAGNFSYGAGTYGDGGPATAAQLDLPYGIAVDTAGNLYIADAGNNLIRKVDTSGVITTIAGNGSVGYSGDGGAATSAEMNHPIDVVTDATGNIFVSDVNNNCIRKINKAGIITTIAGNDTLGFSGDGGLATKAEMYYPCGIALDTAGNMYIADEYNQRIRKVSPAPLLTTGVPELSAAGISVFPNPGDGSFTLQAGTNLHNAAIAIYNIAGEKIYSGIMNGATAQITISQPAGIYILYLETGSVLYRQKIAVINE